MSTSQLPGRKGIRAPWDRTRQVGKRKAASLVANSATLEQIQRAAGKPKGAMGAGKGKDSEWPAIWAKVSPKGVQYCRNHFMKKKCPGNCGRSHNCPMLKNGWACNAAPSEHTPDQCPHR